MDCVLVIKVVYKVRVFYFQKVQGKIPVMYIKYFFYWMTIHLVSIFFTVQCLTNLGLIKTLFFDMIIIFPIYTLLLYYFIISK